MSTNEGGRVSTIRKAVIPVAGLGTRLLPSTKSQPKEMLPVGRKPVVQYVVEELVHAGITEILLITGRAKRAIEDHFDRDEDLVMRLKAGGHESLVDALDYEVLPVTLFYTRQHAPQGLGDALRYARDFVGNEPFVVALGDTIITSGKREVVSRLIDSFEHNKASAVIAVEKVALEDVHKYGIVTPSAPGDDFSIVDLVEKPPMNAAPSNLAIAARYVFGPELFAALSSTLPDRKGEVQLVDAIKLLMAQGMNVRGLTLGADEKRYDIGNFESYFKAFIDFALADPQVGYTVRQYIDQLVNGGPL
jgi:UTP--glucose-1-phosphate uridylyltransferase